MSNTIIQWLFLTLSLLKWVMLSPAWCELCPLTGEEGASCLRQGACADLHYRTSNQESKASQDHHTILKCKLVSCWTLRERKIPQRWKATKRQAGGIVTKLLGKRCIPLTRPNFREKRLTLVSLIKSRENGFTLLFLFSHQNRDNAVILCCSQGITKRQTGSAEWAA